jgi:ion channel-forming bestrophin family protein
LQHYLRGEDGLDHPDFEGVLPAAFIRHGQLDHSLTASRHESMPPSMINGVEGSSTSALTQPEESPERADHHDATKRVRVKRSKQTIKERTPLLPKGSHAISFEDMTTTIPLPLT